MSTKTYKPTQQTKSHIMQQAVDLFNEHGTAAISMNALSEACGMSAGNLQYHYRNKEELIRAILEVMFKDFDSVYEPIDLSFTLDMLRNIMRLNFESIWKYRFFYREFAALLRSDERLAKRFREIQDYRISEQEKLIRGLAGAGVVRSDLNPKELRNMVHIGWVLGNTWLSFAESMGQTIDDAAMEQAVDIMVQHYKPYLEAK